MLREQTVDKMISMKMYKMAEAFKDRLGRDDHGSLDHAEFVGLLIDDEYRERQNKKVAAKLRGAKFKGERLNDAIFLVDDGAFLFST